MNTTVFHKRMSNTKLLAAGVPSCKADAASPKMHRCTLKLPITENHINLNTKFLISCSQLSSPVHNKMFAMCHGHISPPDLPDPFYGTMPLHPALNVCC